MCKTLGELILKAKGDKSMTEFAGSCGTDPSTLYRIVNGSVKSLRSVPLLKEIANKSEGLVSFEELVEANTGKKLSDILKEKDVIRARVKGIAAQELLDYGYSVKEEPGMTFNVLGDVDIKPDIVLATSRGNIQKYDVYFIMSYDEKIPDTLEIFNKLNLYSQLQGRRYDMQVHMVALNPKTWTKMREVSWQTDADGNIFLSMVRLVKGTIREERVGTYFGF